MNLNDSYVCRQRPLGHPDHPDHPDQRGPRGVDWNGRAELFGSSLALDAMRDGDSPEWDHLLTGISRRTPHRGRDGRARWTLEARKDRAAK